MEWFQIASMEWVQKTIRTVGGVIDRAVYSVVEVLMQLIIDLSNTEIFSQSVIDEFARRIYLILGLVMVFKMMISFFQILINPDKMDDKEQGVTGILKRVVIALALMFMVPSIFGLAREIQIQVLPIIPKVILGVSIDGDDEREKEEMMSNVGRIMAFNSFLPFFTYDNPSCDDGSIMGPYNDTGDYSIWSVASAVDMLEAKDETCSTDKYGFRYKYNWPLSSIVGIYLIFVLVTVAVKIAIRAIKLGICEFIAPIPIASYIDPKTSKQAFDTWVKTSVQVYLDLFIRLIIVYFVVFIFMTVLKTENLSVIYASLGNDVGRGALVTLFLIVGLLTFVKDAPKFITDMLGIKGGGEFMDMFKGAGWKAFTPFTVGNYDIARSNATTQYERLRSQGRGRFKSALGAGASALVGVGSSTARALKATAQGKTGNDLRAATFDASVKARNDRNYKKDVVFQNDYSRFDYYRDKRRDKLQIPSADESDIRKYESFDKMFSNVKSMADHGMQKKDDSPDSLQLDFKDLNNRWHNMSLGEVYAMSDRKEGEVYDGEIWTKDKVRFWSDSRRRAEKEAQYVKEAQMLKSGDSDSVLRFQNLKNSILTNSDLFNGKVGGESASQQFIDKFNATVVDPSHQISSMTDFYNLLNSDPTTGVITADFIKGTKTAMESLKTAANLDMQAAQARRKQKDAARKG